MSGKRSTNNVQPIAFRCPERQALTNQMLSGFDRKTMQIDHADGQTQAECLLSFVQGFYAY